MIYQPSDHANDGDSAPVRRYQVTVGHASVTVEGTDASEAVEAARIRLCDDMPRMWDVIRTMDSSRFQITEIHAPGSEST